MQSVWTLLDGGWRKKGKKEFVQVQRRFAACAINTGNDIMSHPPTIFCLCSCGVPYDCEPTTGAWSCHVGHWYVLRLYHPVVHGIGQTQIIVQQSVEKMVRIKQTLIASTQTEGGNN